MLIALHKPFGMLSQFTREAEGQVTLADVDPELPKGIYPIGRLDKDSEGLLLLSDEKRLVAQILEPASRTTKVYLVQVDGAPTEEAIRALRKGVTIRVNKRDHKTKRAEVTVVQPTTIAPRVPPIRVRQSIPTTWLRIEITEGKNRQVRKMCAVVGFPALRLIRTDIGRYSLDDLAGGKWKEAE